MLKLSLSLLMNDELSWVRQREREREGRTTPSLPASGKPYQDTAEYSIEKGRGGKRYNFGPLLDVSFFRYVALQLLGFLITNVFYSSNLI